MYRVYRGDVIENLSKLAGSHFDHPDLIARVFTVLDNVEAWKDGLFCGALKVPKKAEARTSVEIEAMRKVSHRHLVRLIASDQNRPAQPEWFVMEFFPRGTPKPSDYAGRVQDVLQQGANIARALSALHEAGYFHRDIKPTNILLDDDGSWILADLGIVLDEDGTRHTEGSFPGSKDWMPPWRMTKVPFDARFDLYMLAKTLFYYLIPEKLKDVTWLSDDDDFNLSKKMPNVAGAGDLHEFFVQALAKRPESFPFEDARQMALRLEQLARVVSGELTTRVLLTVPTLDGVVSNSPPGLSLFVPSGTTRLTFRVYLKTRGTTSVFLYSGAVLELTKEGMGEAEAFVCHDVEISAGADRWFQVQIHGNASPLCLYVVGA